MIRTALWGDIALSCYRARRAIALALLLAAGMLLAACAGREASSATVLLDGARWDGGALDPEAGGLRVYVTWDGQPLIDLPFAQAHTVEVRSPGGGHNVVALTGDSVCMESADCENQDCVQMGTVTRDNLEVRVMGGFIICLPHRVSVEVRGDQDLEALN